MHDFFSYKTRCIFEINLFPNVLVKTDLFKRLIMFDDNY